MGSEADQLRQNAILNRQNFGIGFESLSIRSRVALVPLPSRLRTAHEPVKI